MLDTAGHSEPIFFSGSDTEFASFALGGTLGNGFKTAVVANALSHIKLLLFTEQNFSPKSTTSMTFQTGLHPTEEVREGAAKVLCLTFYSVKRKQHLSTEVQQMEME